MTSPAAAITSPTDLIWIQTGFIGDIVLSTGALALAARALPGLRQHVVTTELGQKVLADFPGLSSVIVFRKTGKGLSAFAAFRQVGAALRQALPAGARPVLLMAHRSFRSGFLGRYLGYPSVAFAEADAAWLASVRVPRVAVLHEAVRVAMLLEPLGVPREQIAQACPVLTPLAGASRAELGEEIAAMGRKTSRLIGIAPGSVWGTKRWTTEGFVALAQRLLSEAGAGLVLVGAAAERELAESIRSALGPGGAERVVNFAGRTTLADLRWLFPKLSLLVTNDSSPIHFASAVGTPTVAVFGATIPPMGFGPLAPRSQSVGKVLACRPCSDHGPQVCPLGHFKCMRELSADTVYAACRQVLS